MTKKRRVYLIGWAPSQQCLPCNHCLGRFKRTICAISGLAFHAYDSKFARANVLTRPETGTINDNTAAKIRSKFLIKRVKRQWIKDLGEGNTDLAPLIVCAGTKAFTFLSTELKSSSVELQHVEMIQIPHPSGRNRQLNTEQGKEHLSSIILRAASEAIEISPEFHATLNPPAVYA